MEEVNGYNISQKEFNTLSKWTDNIYNLAVIIDYFCENQPEIEELYNLAPVVKNYKVLRIPFVMSKNNQSQPLCYRYFQHIVLTF